MTVKWRMLLLFAAAWLVQPLTLFALQNDSLAFDQGRLRIWCETARFVYEDNGADSLLPSIHCQSLEALKNSMASTDANLGVLRLMNSVDKPAIYKGFSTDEAKLQKLSGEIARRLKQSSVRQNNPVRSNRVDSLEQQLRLVARQTGLQSEAGGAIADSPTAAATDASDEVVVLPTTGDVADRTSASLPWNEILQWIAILVLGGLLFWRLRDLEHRYSRLKREYRTLEKQVNEFIINNVYPGPSPIMDEVVTETEVRNVVKEELRQNKPMAKNTPAGARAPQPPTAAPQPHAPASKPASAAPQPPSTPHRTPTAAPQPPTAAPLQDAGDVQVSPQPLSTPAPVPLPPLNTKNYPATAEGNDGEEGLYFDKMPFRGGFHQNEMSRERQRDSLYTIRVLPGQSNEAEYWISEDPDVQRYAMQNGFSFFEEGCEFTEVEENPARVVNEEKGRLRKDGTVWKILQKAKVRFE